MDDERVDDSQRIARGKPPNSDSPTLERTSSGPRQNESDDAIPDPIREMGDELALVREFESLPQHPIHLLDRFLHLAPIAGLFDLGRTIWWRRKNPFNRMLWRELWGRHPFLLLALTVPALSTVPFVVGVALSPLYSLVNKLVSSSAGGGGGILSGRVYLLFPIFLGDTAMWLAAFFAWKLFRFKKRRDFDSELAAVPFSRPFLFRALAVQLAFAALLVVFLGNVATMVALLFQNSFKIPYFPRAASPVNYVLWIFGLNPPVITPVTFHHLLSLFLSRLYAFVVDFLYLGLYLIVFLRARSFRRLIGGTLVVGYGLGLFSYLVFLGTNAVISWVNWRTSVQSLQTLLRTLIPLVVYLLVVGAVWRLAYTRFCKPADQPNALSPGAASDLGPET